jgi:hypothetical protein
MTDVYVYYFTADPGGKNISSKRATLEAIEGRGEPVMESQIVVDHTQLDGSGFLTVGVGYDSNAVNDFSAQIHSLELRAASRDSEALALDDSTVAKDKYMLGLESRELRRQARNLKIRRTELMAAQRRDAQRAVDFGGNLTTE